MLAISYGSIECKSRVLSRCQGLCWKTSGWSLKVVREVVFLRLPYPTAADLEVLVVEALVEVLGVVLVWVRDVVQSVCPIDRCKTRC